MNLYISDKKKRTSIMNRAIKLKKSNFEKVESKPLKND